jgi:hypothetical protein
MEVWSQRKVNFSWITDDAGRSSVKIEAHLNKLILDAIDQTLSKKLSLLPQQKKALSMLRRSLGSGRQPLLTAAY